MSAASTAAFVVAGLVMTGAAFRRARRPDVLARLAGTERRSWRDAWRSPPSLFVARVVDVELPVSLDDAWRVWRLATPVAALVVAAVMGPVPAALVVVAACAAPFVVVALARSRSAAAYDADLVVALDAIGRGVRSGASLGQAIGEAAGTVRGQVERDIHRVASDIRRGGSLTAALDGWRAQRGRASVELAVGALALAADTGGPPARVIEEVAAALRQRLQTEGEARAMGAQARLSAIVVGVAPVGFALLTTATDKRNAHMLFGTPLGLTCVALGLGLDAIGAVWMHRISESVTA